jgi:hypothetical protein
MAIELTNATPTTQQKMNASRKGTVGSMMIIWIICLGVVGVGVRGGGWDEDGVGEGLGGAWCGRSDGGVYVIL